MVYFRLNREGKVSVGAVDEFEGHGSRPVVGMFGTAGGAEPGMTAERIGMNKSNKSVSFI